MQTKRTFISIDLPPAVIDALRRLSVKQIYWIKWMKPENLHITLNFLGDLTPTEIETAKKIIADTIPFYHPFTLVLAAPREERDMLWLEVGDCEALFEMHKELKSKLKAERIGKRERWQYHPHILVAKSKTGRLMTILSQPKGQAGGHAWQKENFQPLEFKVDRINLYESELTPGAATHKLIQSFPLG